MNFVLVYSGGKMPEGQAEQMAVVKDWEAWYKKLGGALVDPGKPFTQKAKNVAGGGRISDGAAGPAASGYSIVQADSLDAAAKIAQDCPVLKSGASISVYETFSPPGM